MHWAAISADAIEIAAWSLRSRQQGAIEVDGRDTDLTAAGI